MGQFIEDIVQRPRRIERTLRGVTALPRAVCGLSLARGGLTRRTRTRPWRHSPDEQLPTHDDNSLFTGDDSVGHAWILETCQRTQRLSHLCVFKS
jgi:hypothetical protein